MPDDGKKSMLYEQDFPRRPGTKAPIIRVARNALGGPPPDGIETPIRNGR